MPVWPICFWRACPDAPPIRQPKPRTPMSRIVTPPSAIAPMAASAAKSIVSLSGCLPNLVMWIPRIQTSSLAMSIALHRLVSVTDRLGPILVRSHDVGRQAHLHAGPDVLGVGRHIDDIGADARPAAVDHAGHEGHRDPRRGVGDDREGPQLALGRDGYLAELGLAARRARVAAVEVASTARRALV